MNIRPVQPDSNAKPVKKYIVKYKLDAFPEEKNADGTTTIRLDKDLVNGALPINNGIVNWICITDDIKPDTQIESEYALEILGRVGSHCKITIIGDHGHVEINNGNKSEIALGQDSHIQTGGYVYVNGNVDNNVTIKTEDYTKSIIILGQVSDNCHLSGKKIMIDGSAGKSQFFYKEQCVVKNDPKRTKIKNDLSTKTKVENTSAIQTKTVEPQQKTSINVNVLLGKSQQPTQTIANAEVNTSGRKNVVKRKLEDEDIIDKRDIKKQLVQPAATQTNISTTTTTTTTSTTNTNANSSNPKRKLKMIDAELDSKKAKPAQSKPKTSQEIAQEARRKLASGIAAIEENGGKLITSNNKKLQLKKYQIKLIAEFCAALNQDPSKPVDALFNLPTGCGKTITAASLFSQLIAADTPPEERKQLRVLFLVPTIALDKQTRDKIKEWAPHLGCTTLQKDKNGAYKFSPEHNIYITTYNHLDNPDNLNNLFPDDGEQPFQFLVLDEAHYMTANNKKKKSGISRSQAFKEKIQGKLSTLAFTATPSYGDDKNVYSLLGYRDVRKTVTSSSSEEKTNPVSEVSLLDALIEKSLSPVRTAKVKIDVGVEVAAKLKKLGAGATEESIGGLINQRSYNEKCVQTYCTLIDQKNGEALFGKQAIVPCAGTKHARDMARLFNETINVDENEVLRGLRQQFYARMQDEHIRKRIKYNSMDTSQKSRKKRKNIEQKRIFYNQSFDAILSTIASNTCPINDRHLYELYRFQFAADITGKSQWPGQEEKTNQKLIASTLIKKYRYGGIVVATGSKMLQVGLDVPEAAVELNWSGTNSMVDRKQELGRILRLKDYGRKLHILKNYPRNTELAKYKNSYIFFNDELIYVDGTTKVGHAITIADMAKFKDELQQITNGETSVSLSCLDIYKLMTLNGGHIGPKPKIAYSIDADFGKKQIYACDLLGGQYEVGDFADIDQMLKFINDQDKATKANQQKLNKGIGPVTGVEWQPPEFAIYEKNMATEANRAQQADERRRQQERRSQNIRVLSSKLQSSMDSLAKSMHETMQLASQRKAVINIRTNEEPNIHNQRSRRARPTIFSENLEHNQENRIVDSVDSMDIEINRSVADLDNRDDDAILNQMHQPLRKLLHQSETLIDQFDEIMSNIQNEIKNMDEDEEYLPESILDEDESDSSDNDSPQQQRERRPMNQRRTQSEAHVMLSAVLDNIRSLKNKISQTKTSLSTVATNNVIATDEKSERNDLYKEIEVQYNDAISLINKMQQYCNSPSFTALVTPSGTKYIDFNNNNAIATKYVNAEEAEDLDGVIEEQRDTLDNLGNYDLDEDEDEDENEGEDREEYINKDKFANEKPGENASVKSFNPEDYLGDENIDMESFFAEFNKEFKDDKDLASLQSGVEETSAEIVEPNNTSMDNIIENDMSNLPLLNFSSTPLITDQQNIIDLSLSDDQLQTLYQTNNASGQISTTSTTSTRASTVPTTSTTSRVIQQVSNSASSMGFEDANFSRLKPCIGYGIKITVKEESLDKSKFSNFVNKIRIGIKKINSSQSSSFCGAKEANAKFLILFKNNTVNEEGYLQICKDIMTLISENIENYNLAHIEVVMGHDLRSIDFADRSLSVMAHQNLNRLRSMIPNTPQPFQLPQPPQPSQRNFIEERNPSEVHKLFLPSGQPYLGRQTQSNFSQPPMHRNALQSPMQQSARLIFSSPLIRQPRVFNTSTNNKPDVPK